MTRRMSSRSVVLTGAFVALAMGGTAACDVGSDYDDDEYRDEERHYQCAAEVNGEVEAVDCNRVSEDSSGVGFVYVGGVQHPVFIHSAPASSVRSVQPGQKLPAGGYRIGYTDSAGRTQAGLPPSGPVANNTVKTSVVGKGGAPKAGG